MILKLVKLSLFTLIAVGAFLLQKWAFTVPDIVENIYSKGIYPFISNIGTFLGKISFSISEILLYVFLLSVLFFVGYIFSAIFKPRGEKLYNLAKRIIAFAITLASVYSLFIFNWGLNYARLPLSDIMNLNIRPYTTSELISVTSKLSEKTNLLREKVTENKDGVYTLSGDKSEILTSVQDEFDRYAPEYMNLGAKARVKGVMTPNLLSSTQTMGIFSPFTFEAHINMQMTDVYFASTAAHEYAHLKGFAREDEANFISWYVCHNSKDIDFAYSSNLLALTHALNRLSKADKQAYTSIVKKLHPGIIRDLRFDSSYWEEFETKFSEEAQATYNSYLKTNGAEDGSQSYGRMIDLIIAVTLDGRQS